MNRLIMTADQIYAMAYIIKAKFLDYYYISLSNRSKDNKLWLNEIQNQLVSDGLLVEDFSGDITIDPSIEELIRPLYFGTKESSLDIDILGENEENIGFRFHFLDDKIIMTKTVDEGFEVTNVTVTDVHDIVSGILPSDYSVDSSESDIKLEASSISRVFVVKQAEVEVKNSVEAFVESDGVIYDEDTNNVIHSVSRADFVDRLFITLTEV